MSGLLQSVTRQAGASRSPSSTRRAGWRGLLRLALVAAMMGLAACGSRPAIETYAETKPVIDLDLLASGARAWGVIEDLDGRLVRRMTAEITATDWRDGVLSLTENVTFDDGEQIQRTWTWRKLGPGRLIGTANGVYGEVEAVFAGSVLRKRFDADTRLPDGRMERVTFEDEFYRIDETTLICRSFMSIAGIPIAEASVTIQVQK